MHGNGVLYLSSNGRPTKPWGKKRKQDGGDDGPGPEPIPLNSKP